MLSTWNDENINRMGSAQRGGGKSFKALGDAGLGSSENPPPAQQQQRKLKPLGGYSENAPPSSAAKGKTAASGGSDGAGLLLPGSSFSSRPQQKQRRALGDISNAGLGAAAASAGIGNVKAFGVKQHTPGLKFAVHSDSNKAATPAAGPLGAGPAGALAGTARERSAGPKSKDVAKPRSFVRPDGQVDDVEAVLGRTGDEEEILVERREEQRAARKFARASNFRSSTSRSRSTSFSLPNKAKASPSSRSETRFGRDITNTAASTATPGDGGGGGGFNANGASCRAAPKILLDKSLDSLDSAIERICHDDLEDGRRGLSNGDGEKRGHVDFEDDFDLDMDALTTALEGLDASTHGKVCSGTGDYQGDEFLAEELDLSFV